MAVAVAEAVVLVDVEPLLADAAVSVADTLGEAEAVSVTDTVLEDVTVTVTAHVSVVDAVAELVAVSVAVNDGVLVGLVEGRMTTGIVATSSPDRETRQITSATPGDMNS
jgi:hypothetical protein